MQRSRESMPGQWTGLSNLLDKLIANKNDDSNMQIDAVQV